MNNKTVRTSRWTQIVSAGTKVVAFYFLDVVCFWSKWWWSKKGPFPLRMAPTEQHQGSSATSMRSLLTDQPFLKRLESSHMDLHVLVDHDDEEDDSYTIIMMMMFSCTVWCWWQLLFCPFSDWQIASTKTFSSNSIWLKACHSFTRRLEPDHQGLKVSSRTPERSRDYRIFHFMAMSESDSRNVFEGFFVSKRIRERDATRTPRILGRDAFRVYRFNLTYC